MPNVLTLPERIKIKTTIAVYDMVEVEIDLPYYCKDKNGSFYCVHKPDVVYQIKHSDTFTMVIKTSLFVMDKNIAEATKCPRDEYLEALEIATDNFLKSEA
jgi:hypothetical protein